MSYPTYRTGVNIDPTYFPAAPDPRTAFGMDKIHGFRVVSRESIAAYCDNAKAAGKHILAVVTTQSCPTPGANEFIYAGADIVQIGNEPDAGATLMSPQAYAAYYNHVCELIAQYGINPYICTAGLASGLGNARAYLEQVWPLLNRTPDLVATHCYDGDTQQSANEIIDLWNAVQVPIVVTEWNKSADQIWDMLAMLNGAEGLSSAWNSYFPYTTAMDPTTQGLVDAQGNPTGYGASFVSAPNV